MGYGACDVPKGFRLILLYNKFYDSSKKHLQSAYLYDTIIFAFEYIDFEQSF